MGEIRQSTPADEEAVWGIFQRVVSTGETYVFPVDADRETFRQHWMRYAPMVAVEGGEIVGTYIVKANQVGLGSHIANGSFMVHPGHAGKGIGKKMGLHALDHARHLGFTGMQFNLVVASNEAAVALWKKLGFRIIGTVPGAFRHRRLGLVDAHIMYRDLGVAEKAEKEGRES